ncbi:hypothetical protein BXZ70DRAFT_581955 [Cristinia sonorae]|uniref:Uncharacterized protein n=1 Tax=Cristinia sonorae TaxID=1940300 RepID=A0A8K0UH54_9AGAR|nr:hypothetical protein BXZ70DRAFT_581955 [Cristinia sonorae]
MIVGEEGPNLEVFSLTHSMCGDVFCVCFSFHDGDGPPYNVIAVIPFCSVCVALHGIPTPPTHTCTIIFYPHTCRLHSLLACLLIMIITMCSFHLFSLFIGSQVT